MASSSSPFHLIPEAIIIDEILTRLPVKSLCRFKCVSKQWRFIISSERFVKRHLVLYSPNFPRIMLNTTNHHYHLINCSTHSLFSDHFLTKATHIDLIEDTKMIIGSFNGLLCVNVGGFSEFDFFLWNPSIRKHMKLPCPLNNVNDLEWAEFGFGYDQSNDEYVILVICIERFGSYSMLYRSRTNSWKRIGDFNLGYPAYISRHCKLVAGKFHFPICPEDSFDPENDKFAVLFDIISFDLNNEEYGVIKHPEYGDNVVEIFLEELGGSLCVLCRKEAHSDLWVMKEYGDVESWTKTLTFCHNIVYSRPLIISQSWEMLYRRKFVVYDMNKNNQRVLKISDVGDFGEANVYVESLVWINEEEMETGADSMLEN